MLSLHGSAARLVLMRVTAVAGSNAIARL